MLNNLSFTAAHRDRFPLDTALAKSASKPPRRSTYFIVVILCNPIRSAAHLSTLLSITRQRNTCLQETLSRPSLRTMLSDRLSQGPNGNLRVQCCVCFQVFIGFFWGGGNCTFFSFGIAALSPYCLGQEWVYKRRMYESSRLYWFIYDVVSLKG